MPATRRTRSSGGPTTKGGQSKLSFSGKVTKPTVKQTIKDSKTFSATKSKLQNEIIDIDVANDENSTTAAPKKVSQGTTLGEVTSEKLVAKQAAVELAKPKTNEEASAERVSDAQIRRYWRAREDDRIAARVHQEGLSVEEKILRLFDMTSSYGPCIGIARMKRWVRANKLGLAPPIEVLAVLLKEEKKGNSKIERAYVDELLASKLVAGEA